MSYKQLSKTITITENPHAGCYETTNSVGVSYYIYYRQDACEPDLEPYFKVVPICQGEDKFTVFAIVIRVNGQTASICYKNGTFFRFYLEGISLEERTNFENEYACNVGTYDDMAQQFWHTCRSTTLSDYEESILLSVSTTSIDLPDRSSNTQPIYPNLPATEAVTTEAVTTETIATETITTETLTSETSPNPKEFPSFPSCENNPDGGTLIYLYRENLPLKVVVLDAQGNLRFSQC